MYQTSLSVIGHFSANAENSDKNNGSGDLESGKEALPVPLENVSTHTMCSLLIETQHRTVIHVHVLDAFYVNWTKYSFVSFLIFLTQVHMQLYQI